MSTFPRIAFAWTAGALVVCALSGCATAQFEGTSDLTNAQTALVRGDPALGPLGNAMVRLQEVDNRELGLTQRQARIPAGSHTLVLSCKVTSTGASNTAQIDFKARAGQTYKLRLRILKHYPGCSGVLVDAGTGKIVARPDTLGHAPNLSD